MGVVDAALECYLDDPVRYADLLNGYWFGGRQIVRPEDVQEQDSRLVGQSQRKRKKNSRQKYHQSTRDKVRKVVFGTGVAVITNENQMKIHYAMPVRTMLEDALEYNKQFRAIQREHENAKDLHDPAEYIGQFAAEDKILPTTTIVLYFGKEEWTGPKDLRDLMELDKLPEEVRKYINGYPLHILEVQKFEDIDRFQTDLREVFGFIQRADDKEKINQFLNENAEFFRTVTLEVADVITAVTGNHRLREILEQIQEGGHSDMFIGMEILTKEERETERLEGKREGKIEGRIEGKIEGANDKAKSIARNLSYGGFNADETARLCDVQLDTVQNWFAEWALDE